MINHPVICTSCGILSQNTYFLHQNISLLRGSDNSCTSAYPPKISTCNCQVWVVCTGAAVILGIRIPMDSLASPFIIVIYVPENPRKKTPGKKSEPSFGKIYLHNVYYCILHNAKVCKVRLRTKNRERNSRTEIIISISLLVECVKLVFLTSKFCYS